MNPSTLDELLLAHAAGRLPLPVDLLVASHLTLRPESRPAHAVFEQLGGALLEEIDPEPLDPKAFERLRDRLDRETGPEEAPAPPVEPSAGAPALPAPLLAYVPEGIGGLRWRRYGRIAEAVLDLGSPGFTTRLVRAEPGAALFRHTHEGLEATLVLEGAYRDGTGRYGPGDIELADGAVDHRPTAEPDAPCLCLTVTSAPLRLTGRFLRFLNPFVRL
ncbi:MAG: ChrR family anti-sigma-E factor [Geminicoccaceae bacterium]|nr:ChrR family anti-sigma-E factor [Geminicoccaceae bacterium]